MNKKESIIKRTLFLLLISVLSFFILELGLRDFNISSVFTFISNHKKIMLLSISVYLLFILLFAILFNDLWLTAAFFIYGFTILSFSNFLKIDFRLEPVFPSDIALITSFKDLIQMVDLIYLIMFVVFTVIVFTAVYFLSKKYPFKLFETRNNKIILQFALVLTIFLSMNGLRKVHADDNSFRKMMDSSGFKEFRWDPLRTYQQNGFALGFISNLSGEAMKRPNNYTKEMVYEVLDEFQEAADQRNKGRAHEDFEDISVVYVLSESLADPRNFNGVEIEESPIPYIQDPSDKYAAGKLIVPAYGGGTPNTEYEVLTSLSIQDLESNMALPFQRFMTKFKSFPSFVSEYKRADNTKAISLHSFNSKMFKRRDVYRILGFDEINFEDDMKYDYKVDDNKFISDAASYDEVLDYLNHEEKDIFMHLVTIQNHAVYNDKYKEYKYQPKVEASKEVEESIKYYTQGIHITDQETQRFIDSISKLDRKVAVVFYGDHHPGLYNSLADLNRTFEYATTEFFVYTNFNDKQSKIDTPVSSTNLINYLYDASDVKVNAIHQLVWELRKEVPAGKNTEYLLNDGSVKTKDQLSEKQKELLDKYYLIEYDIIEGKQYSQDYIKEKGW